jgi:Domain of unknown function (DUF4389)/zinc-ribbon domain
MAYCPNCGTELPADARFCPTCGHAVQGGAGAAAPPPPPSAAPPAPPASGGYPARLEIDYPDRSLNRLTTFFRIFAAIPILIVFGLLSGASEGYRHTSGSTTATGAAVGGGVIVIPVVLMLLFRRKYPGWWFEWNRELARFSTRVTAYLALLDDRYPSTDETQSVHLELERPDGERLSRGLPLIKWLLAIPHYIVLLFLSIAAFFVIIFAWFAILFTGRYPRGAFDFVVGVFRWSLRVEAYAFLLITDQYPPFRLDP